MRNTRLTLDQKDYENGNNTKTEEVKEVLKKRSKRNGPSARIANKRLHYKIAKVTKPRGENEHKKRQQDKTGRPNPDNAHGTREENSWPHDFTINALDYETPNRTTGNKVED